MKKLSFLFLIGLLFSACDEGTPFDNLPPETQLFLKEINLSGQDRLNSVVKMHWSGEDQDGYVTAYEISLDEASWTRVTIQDSTFRFDLMPGSDTTDIDFWVRAIDNENTVDPSPAYLRVPIRNSPPVARLDSVNTIPDTVYSVFSFLWEIEDLDGVSTLDSLEIRLNDGPWYTLERNTRFVSIVGEAPKTAGRQSALVYEGTAANLRSELIEGLEINGSNRFFLRAKDIAGKFSPVDTSAHFFVKAQKTDLLVVDDHPSDQPDPIYAEALLAVTTGYDFFNLHENLPPYWDPTFGLFLKLYDKVFWYSDGSQRVDFGGQMLLDVAANQLQLYLNEGGKLMTTVKFVTAYNDKEVSAASPLFGLSPMDSLSSASGQARIAVDSLARPTAAFANDFPTLVCANFISGADPFYAKDPVNDLYKAQLTKVGSWKGPSTIAARALFTNGKTNQVFFSVELHKLSQDKNAMEAIFDQVINREFDW